MFDQRKNKVDWTSVNWEPLVERLLVYATIRLMRRTGNIKSIYEPSDFVYQSIEKTISGTRAWDSKKVDLHKHLMSVINSDMNHYLTSYYLKNKVSSEVIDLVASYDEQKEREEKSEVEAFYNYLKKKGDEDLIELARAITMGSFSTIEISSDMGIDHKDVNNMKKRLKRAALNFKDGYDYGHESRQP